MQGQPGLAVDKYEFLADLVIALCETKDYSTAQPGDRRHTIKLTLEKIARVEEINWLECRHYRDASPEELQELFATVFNKTDTDGDHPFIQVFNAARRAIDTFAFGTQTHPSHQHQQRVSPRLAEQQKKRSRVAGSDASESERSSYATRIYAEATSAEPSGQSVARNVYVPDGTLRVKHPPELRRYPDVDKITGLTEKLYQKLNALLHVANPFTFKNDHWVAMLDEAFIWMLHMQGSLSFSAQLRNKVHQLIFETLAKMETSPAVWDAIKIRPNGGWPVDVFAKQLKYRTHPPARDAKKASMKRYGPVAKTPYTSPLIQENILEWDGRTELTLEESSLKAGDQGYEQLPFALADRQGSNAQETPGPAAVSLSFSAAPTLYGAGGSTDAPRPAHDAPPAALLSSMSAPYVVSSQVPWSIEAAPHVQHVVWRRCGSDEFSAVSLQSQAGTSVFGAGAATVGASAPWESMPPPQNCGAAGTSMLPQQLVNTKDGKRASEPTVSKAPAPAPAAAAAPTPEPVRVIRAPEHLPVALKQTLETLLIGKTVKSFQLLKDVNPEVEKDLCRLDAPYLVASVFQSAKQLVYYVGKPVAKYDGKLICWYPAAQGQGTIETAGIFDQVQDIALAPTFVMKINAEDGATDDAKHGDEAQAAAQDYTAEGKTTKAKKTALVKDTLAWLVAKCKIQGEELSSQTQKRMARAMTNILINDPDTLAELQKSM